MFKIIDTLSVPYCDLYPTEYFVYGDNLIKKGTKGQAIIRPCVNAIGVPTKRFPSKDKTAYFSDRIDEKKKVKMSLERLRILHRLGYTVNLPRNKIGDGLAKLSEKSPDIHKMIDEFYKEVNEVMENDCKKKESSK